MYTRSIAYKKNYTYILFIHNVFDLMNVYFSIWFVSKKTMNTFNLRLKIACWEFFSLKYIFLSFSKQMRWLFMFVHQKSWKLTFKTGLSVHNIHLNLCGQVENSKWILCSRKTGVKYIYIKIYDVCTNNI